MKVFIRKIVKDSFLDRPLRKFYSWYCHLKDNSLLAKKNYDYDNQVYQIMAQTLQKNSVCIDVGCARGIFLREMLHFAPQGKHFGFEPLPHNYEFLKQEFGEKAIISPVALSNKKGEVSFHFVKSNSGYSGLQEREYETPNEEIEIIKVQTDKLDDIIDKNIKIDFIKIDVEGGEYDMLVGGSEIIKKHKPIIVFEFVKGGADKYGVTPAQMFALLTSDFQFKIALFEDWLAKRPAMNLATFDKYFEDRTEFYFIAYP